VLRFLYICRLTFDLQIRGFLVESHFAWISKPFQLLQSPTLFEQSGLQSGVGLCPRQRLEPGLITGRSSRPSNRGIFSILYKIPVQSMREPLH
jgi:hypothetical protein